jgi:hypothetical protein
MFNRYTIRLQYEFIKLKHSEVQLYSFYPCVKRCPSPYRESRLEVRFEVFVVVNKKSSAFWDMIMCSLTEAR